MTESLGTFTFVLHSHIPFVLAHGRFPHGADWLSEAAAETYLPLLDVCHRLIDEGISPKITLGLTPVLVEQLRDPSFHDEFSGYLRARIETAVANEEQFRANGNYHMPYLARFWEDWYGKALRDFEVRYSRDIVRGFAELQNAGHIEIITSSATLGYSALLSSKYQCSGSGKARSCRLRAALRQASARLPTFPVGGVAREERRLFSPALRARVGHCAKVWKSMPTSSDRSSGSGRVREGEPRGRVPSLLAVSRV